MDQFFSNLALQDIHQDLLRNIVSLRESQNLFDDLSNDDQHWELAQQLEDKIKPHPYQSHTPVIHRPFEDAEWFNAITYPFKHWQASRYSDGTFGVWYGSDSIETTVYETAYHWYHGLLSDAGFEKETIVIERKLYVVACDVALLDLRPLIENYPDLIHKTDYTYTHLIGNRIHREGHPGLMTRSVRHEPGESYAIFNATVLSDPRIHSFLTYTLEDQVILVAKERGRTWLKIAVT